MTSRSKRKQKKEQISIRAPKVRHAQTKAYDLFKMTGTSRNIDSVHGVRVCVHLCMRVRD